jgi:hypothetical protein
MNLSIQVGTKIIAVQFGTQVHNIFEFTNNINIRHYSNVYTKPIMPIYYSLKRV